MEQEKASTKRAKAQSLQARMILTVYGIVFLIGTLLAAALTWTQFFQRVDQQSINTFYGKAEEKVEQVGVNLSNIVKCTIAASNSLNSFFSTEATLKGDMVSNGVIGGGDYHTTRVQSTSYLLDLLDKVDGDGAYYLLASDSGSYTGVWICDTTSNYAIKSRDTYELLLGSSDISKEFNLNIHQKWDLTLETEGNPDYYTMPLWAMEADPYGNLEQYGYWTIPEGDSNLTSIYYSVPLMDELNRVYGVVGIEISQDYFEKVYLSQGVWGYENSFHFLGKIQDEQLSFSENTPNLEVASQFLFNGQEIAPAKGTDLSNLYICGGNVTEELMFTADKLHLYSTNSPFLEDEWLWMSFVPSSEPYQNSMEILGIFLNSFCIAMGVGMVATLVVTRFSTRKIVGLSEYVNNLSPHQVMEFELTNLKEIDDLTAAVKMLNQKILDSSTTLDRIIKLTALNLGGYEVIPKEGTVVLTEFIRILLGISEHEQVDLDQWEDYYYQLTKQPAIDKENTYRYTANGQKLWLKIIDSEKEDGSIGMVLDVTREMEDAIEVQNQLDYDALTKLYSRAAFHREVNLLVHRDPDLVGAMLFIDLDNLKYTNDTFGHEAGDTLIKSASNIFEQFSVYGGVAARFSGDEFAIYIHGYESKEKILRIIKEKFNQFKNATIKVPDGSEQRIRFSTGVAWYPQDSQDVPQLVKLADFAMYQAKHNAKGTMREFDQKIYDETAYMMENREAINKLIEEGLVRFMFQPIVNLRTGEIFAYEALMRSTLDAFKSPLEVLKVAASQSKSGELEKMLIKKTLSTAFEQLSVIGDRKIFINSITSQIITPKEFALFRDSYGDFLHNVVIEIKEAEDDTPEMMQEKLQHFRECGMQVAIDDFKGGFSNEMSIVSVNPDLIKIDMSMGQGIAVDEGKKMLLSSIIDYSHSKNIRIIAEGIEEFEDLHQLQKLGVDYVQGYVLARPDYEFLEISQEKKDQILQGT